MTVAQLYTRYNKTEAGRTGQLVVFILCYQLCNPQMLLTFRFLHVSQCCLCLQIWKWIVDSYKECIIKTEMKVKGKGHPRTCHEGPEGEWRYSSTLPSSSALDEVGGQRHAPAVLPPGKTRYPLYRRLGGPQGRSGRVRKNSPPLGFNPQTLQLVASRYTD